MGRYKKNEHNPDLNYKIFYNSDLYHTENNLYQNKKAEYDKIINEILSLNPDNNDSLSLLKDVIDKQFSEVKSYIDIIPNINNQDINTVCKYDSMIARQFIDIDKVVCHLKNLLKGMKSNVH